MSGITSLFQYDFMRNAFLAVLIITPLFGILGTMIVNNKMAFFSDALGHSALTGIALGMVLGISNMNISMILFAVIFALLLNYVKNKTNYGADTIISVFSSIFLSTPSRVWKVNGVSKRLILIFSTLRESNACIG